MLPISVADLSEQAQQVFGTELQVLTERGIPHQLLREDLTLLPGELLFVPEAGRAGYVWVGGVEWTDARDEGELLRRLEAWDFTG